MVAKKTLQETVELMLSSDPVDNLKAEYYQLENRLIDTNEELMAYDLDTENSDNYMNNTRNLLSEKISHMRQYLFAIQREAKNKGIVL